MIELGLVSLVILVIWGIDRWYQEEKLHQEILSNLRRWTR